MSQSLTIRRLDDLHAHFRLDSVMQSAVPHTARYCGRAIAMPNTRPRAILSGEDVIWYRDQLNRSIEGMNVDFEPLMTIDIRDSTMPEMIHEAKKAGAVAGKVYPLGFTTNSDQGLRDFKSQQITDVFKAMSDAGLLLLLHGELGDHRTLVTERENYFLPTLEYLAEKNQDLKIVLEHVTTENAILLVKALGDNVAATITAHHLFLTLNDVIGDGIQPHHMCMPVPKHYRDRDALVGAAISGHPKFFFGSDTAPHLRENKECEKGACGVYTAPVVPEILATAFEQADALDRLENFTSRFGAEFYGLPLNKGIITLEKDVEGWVVPEEYDGIVPFRAKRRLKWKCHT